MSNQILIKCCGIEIPNSYVKDGRKVWIMVESDVLGDYIVLDDGRTAYFNYETYTYITEDGMWESPDADEYFATPFEYLRDTYGDVFTANPECIASKSEIEDYADLTGIDDLMLYIAPDEAFIDGYRPKFDDYVNLLDIYDLETLMSYLDDFLECEKKGV